MKIVFTLLLSLFVLCLSACSSIGYYYDAVNGHLTVLSEQESIREILQQPDLASSLRVKLELATQAREFASAELFLPDNDSYRYYSDIKRPYVVWNVIATQHYSITARQWCFLIVGCVSYRGYFNKADAQAYADTLVTQGYDVNVSGAQAYSTLGWLDDPLLSTMIKHNEARLVGLIFHELAHQQVYIDDDSSFNEAFATSVEIEGVRRWFKRQTTSDVVQTEKLYQQYLIARQHEIEFKQMLKSTQLKLETLFKSTVFKNSSNREVLKQQVFAQLQIDYRILKKSWQDYAGYDAWMKRDLNNAHLALVATYHDKVPAFLAVLKSVDSDIKKYYELVAIIGELPEKKRNQRLSSYQNLATE